MVLNRLQDTSPLENGNINLVNQCLQQQNRFLSHPGDGQPPLSYPTLVQLDPGATLATLQATTDVMQSDTWGIMPQTSAKLGRAPHQRESSLSSLGSTGGPASPFSQTTSNPQIALNDYRTDGLPDLTGQDGNDSQNQYYQLAKSVGGYSSYQNLDQALPEMAYPLTIPGPVGKPRTDRSMPSAPTDFSSASTRSHPTSVASSVAGDSPATPTNGEAETADRRKKAFGNPPKLDRTISDVYGDELYNPNFAITSASPPSAHLSISPISNDLFNQRLSAANSQHLGIGQSPILNQSRDRSPFRTDSPLVQSSAGPTQSNVPFSSTQRLREQAKARQDAQLMQQQVGPSGEPETPKTISPKDAILEFNESDGDANFPLFPTESTNFEMNQLAKVMLPQQGMSDAHHQMLPGQVTQTMPNAASYLAAQLPLNLQLPQQYPFVGRTQGQPGFDTPPRLSSAGSSSTDSAIELPGKKLRPGRIGADGGTYTCTYHGCTLRFETPALLQKHKREGHRQTQGLGLQSRQDGGMTSSLINSQAGPHRCDRINPSTGKPCGTIFSRPYDLTRHEDTIHNARKQKVRCDLCTEEKTFSRADALTRHYRVCHPDMELPGKHRRRG